MRGQFEVEGFRNNTKAMKMERKKLTVNITSDKIGTTVSISDESDGTQFTIPFDYFLESLKKGRWLN